MLVFMSVCESIYGRCEDGENTKKRCCDKHKLWVEPNYDLLSVFTITDTCSITLSMINRGCHYISVHKLPFTILLLFQPFLTPALSAVIRKGR